MTDSNPFENSIAHRLSRAYKTENLDAAANALFGPTVDAYGEYFEDLKTDLRQANIDVLYRTYVSKMFLYATLASIFSIGAGLIYGIQNGAGILGLIRYTIGLPIVVFIAVFAIMYYFPSNRASKRRKQIDENLPFALNHLGAIATSGIPPSSMFELLNSFEEYGAISDEAGEVSRRVNVFGEDLTTALREIAERSPSDDWAEILYGIVSTVETGGNLESYLQEKADEALFEYNMEREKDIEKLSTYASFYTAILIAAPVFLVVVLAVMNLLGGTIAGYKIRDLMWMGVHVVIPGINALFVIFLSLTVE